MKRYMMYNSLDIDSYINEEIEYMENELLSKKNVLLICMKRYKKVWICQVKSFMLKETYRFIRRQHFKKIVKNILNNNISKKQVIPIAELI